MAETFYLIDTNSSMYQAFYGIRRLDDPAGNPVNAAYGIAALLMRLIGRAEAAYVAAAMDPPGKTFRHEKFADYKATRKPMPSDLADQIPIIQEIIQAFGVPLYMEAGFEADDVIATVARAADEHGLETRIVTRDKDAKQLLNERTHLYNSRDGALFTAETLREEMGLTPPQIVDFLGLSGDASDNIPGVPGVGPKTALTLLHEYGSVEEVLANADNVKGKKLAENLHKFAEQARLSRELAQLRYDVPVEIDIEKCRTKPLDRNRLVELFERLGFKRFLKEIAGAAKDSAKTTPRPTASALFATSAPAAPSAAAKAVERLEGDLATVDAGQYHLVNTEIGLDALVKLLSQQPEFSVDTETTSQDPMRAELVGLSFAWKAGEAYYVPVRAPEGEDALDVTAVLDALRPLLEDPDRGKVGQNIKYDIIVLRRNGVNLRGVACDTMVAAWLLDSSRAAYGIDNLAETHLRYRKIPTTDLIGKKRSEQITMDLVPSQKVSDYACEDADIAWRLKEKFEPMLEEAQLTGLFVGIEIPLIHCLAEMEFNGIALDEGRLAEMSKKLEGQIEALAAKIHDEAGEEFNIASTKQLAEILFDKRGLKPVRKTKTGFSTDVDVLEQLAYKTGDPLPEMILEWRGLTKLKSTYVDALPALRDPATGRVHTSFNQTGTATGRLSSSNPNLQNLPIRTETGREIRNCVVAREGCVLLTADYSQIELRMLAHLSEDPSLCEAFRQGEDIHRSVASQIFGVAPDEVTPEMRRQSKAVNFGIIYGQSPFGLSREVGIPMNQAKDFIDKYFARFDSVRAYFDGVLAEAEAEQSVRTILNRRRPLPEIVSQSPARRSAAQRAAMNTVLQGSAADLIKVAMNNIFARIEGDPAVKMLMQIHDELVFEIEKNSVAKYRAIVETEMSGAMRLHVPLKVNIADGTTWLKAE